jgi:Zn-dependent M28 family amino/carboxypeptidase
LKRLVPLFTSACFFLAGCASPALENCSINLDSTELIPTVDPFLLDSVPRSNAGREALVLAWLEDAGCPKVSTQQIKGSRQQNIICLIAGNSENEILIGAHYDKLGATSGVADNWTGVTTLVTLAAHYGVNQPNHTLRFVAFGAEEKDLLGSKAYVAAIRQGLRPKPTAMLNVDTVGIESLQMDRRGSPNLRCVGRAVASALGTPLSEFIDRSTTGDWEPFARFGIESLSFNAVNRENLLLLHTHRDNRSLVDDDLFQNSFRVIAGTLSAIDDAPQSSQPYTKP